MYEVVIYGYVCYNGNLSNVCLDEMSKWKVIEKSKTNEHEKGCITMKLMRKDIFDRIRLTSDVFVQVLLICYCLIIYW